MKSLISRLALVARPAVLAVLQATALHAAEAPAPMAFSEIGAKATADYQGDAIGVMATPEGASLRTGFQKLAGRVTTEGLWLESTDGESDGLRLTAAAVGREGVELHSLPAQGFVAMADKTVTWTRPGMVEEYSVSVDGVRQDFILAEAPAGTGALSVELALTGARAEAQADGARLVLAKSGRELAYSRLRVTDATGGEVMARLEVLSPNRLAVRVDDTQAVYPVRIDPTFSDADWVSMNPGIPGTNETVNAAVVDSAGNLYIGGWFTAAGGVLANRIAKWNGSAWSALGSGLSGSVSALAVSGSDLYAGGDFTTAGGVVANRIAKWNGSVWSALGSGLSGSVSALAVSGSDLYAGGSFTTAGGVATNYIAKWNGSAWSALGTGMGSSVTALAVSGSDLYAGGLFTTAGGVATNYIAKWNGSAWSALGSGMGSSVSVLAVSGSNLYVGGSFTTAGGVTANRIAKWNGSAWSALGSGLSGSVSALAVSGSDLYAGGDFTTAGGGTANYIAKWNGSAWSSLGSGVGSSVSALAMSGSDLYAGGGFTTTGGVTANRIAKWNGSAWSALGSGLSGSVSALAVSGSDLYAGGDFTTAGGVVANRIAKWNGSVWSALGSGLSGSVSALAVSGSDLYAGGSFTTAGGVTANCIAKWNGSAWSALGSGMSSGVTALAVSGSDLYAGGSFTTAGGVTANRIAKWNGSAWSALGSGLSSNVYALAVSGSDLYVGGSFTTAGGVTANRIAKWNGSAWSALGSGLSGSVSALAMSGSDLYAGGSFNTAGGVAANCIAKWNGSAWSSLGSGVTSYVYAIAAIGSDIYVAGSFSNAGGAAANRIAKWNGSAWSALGSGVGSYVYALAAIGSDVYVGGSFITVGSQVSPYLAKAIIAARIQVEQPVGSAVPYGGTKSFGKVSQGSVSDLTFTIRNIGQSALNLTGGPLVAVSGTDAALFTVTVQPSSPIPSDGTTTFTVRFAPTSLGIKNAQVSISSDAETPNYSLLLTGEGIGAAPVIGNSGTATAKVGQSFSYLISATNSPFLYGASGLPPGLVLNSSNGLIIGTPTTAGTYDITLSATNVYGRGTGWLSLTVNPPAPVISSADTATAVAGQSFSYQIMASNSPTSYGASGLPDGLSVNTSSGLISGTPTSAGSSSITLSATNAGGTGTKALNLTINPPAPVISSADTATAVAGQSFSYQITASNSPTSYAASGLPTGLSIDTGSGLISGMPTAAGSYHVLLGATNSSGTGTKWLTLTVNSTVGETLGAWRQQYFGTAENSGNAADLASPDGDGIPNLVKYALLMTPGRDGSNRLPRAELQSGRLAITFQRSPSREDASIIVEAQSGLGGVWTEIARSSAGGAFTGPANVTETDAGSGNPNVNVQDIPVSATRRFMRVRVERQ